MKKLKIERTEGFELMDSRGNPTVGARVTLSDGSIGFALAPSGASTGEFEAHEKRDGDVGRYGGRGVRKAAESISGEINDCLTRLNGINQRAVDSEMIKLDGTENKSRLGANAVLSVSLATAKAAAAAHKLPLYRYLGGINAETLPCPMMNILNGGVHSSNNIDIQEFMIVPYAAESFSEGLRRCSEVYKALAEILKSRGMSTAVGDEGGFAPDLASDEEAIKLITEAIFKAGYSDGEIKIALDAASSEWYENGEYKLPKRGITETAEGLCEYYESLCDKYPIISIEDGVAEEDWDGWEKLTHRLGNRIRLVGDDLFVTDTERLKKGIEKGVANSVLIKPNQIGTLTETLDVIRLAKKHGYGTVISHRSGETEDTTIAELAVAVNSELIKSGAPCRTERVAKYNRLLMIEAELNSQRPNGNVSGQ